MKCPRCFMSTGVLKSIKIRTSPRKKKKTARSISLIVSGRVEKRKKSFLSKTASIAPHSPSHSLVDTFLDEASTSSGSCASPGTPSSDDSGSEIPNEAEIYEYGECSRATCCFKFCVKCNCKYHPQQVCKELSPASPSSFYKSSVISSRQSKKSLKRLIYKC